jgi:hypothetical protein
LYCKRFKGTWFTKYCIFRQEKAEDLLSRKVPLGKFAYCLNMNGKTNCSFGKKIRECKLNIAFLDVDIKRILFQYNKPPKYKLKKKSEVKNEHKRK